MAELLKEIYNDRFFQEYSDVLQTVIKNFDKSKFISRIKNDKWNNYSLKERMNILMNTTDDYLPIKFNEKLLLIYKIIDLLFKNGVKSQNLEYIFLCDIVSKHGLDDLKSSMDAMEIITQFTSFEFAGRMFIQKYPTEMMQKMKEWASHSSENVRRYASEGCRPRLPWGIQLRQFVENPAPILPVLEILKEDSSEYVRKSVANNLNDISKNQPAIVLDLAKRWLGQSKHTDWIIKHGLRTLLKNGNETALTLFGHSKKCRFTFSNFKLDRNSLVLNDTLSFSFEVMNDENQPTKFRIEYYIFFVKSNGSHSKKIFKISEILIAKESKMAFSKTLTFKNLTTRKHYGGKHKISIVINGLEQLPKEFDLEV